MPIDSILPHLVACVAGAAFALYASNRAFAWAGENEVGFGVDQRTVFGATLTAGILVLLACAMARDARGALGIGVLFAGLAYLALIDLRTMLIPLWPAVALVGAGLLFRASGDELLSGALAAAAAAALFWALSALYKAVRGREGLGSGDALMAACLGAWLPASSLAWSVAFGGLATLAFVLFAERFRRRDQGAPTPFAPGLALGAYVAVMLWGL